MLLPGDKIYFVYIMASRTHVLYTGFTSELVRRVAQHKAHRYEGFTDHYNCDRLVYFERFGEPSLGIAREKQIKRWRREKKLLLIARKNPTWQDLSENWGKPQREDVAVVAPEIKS